MFRKTVARKLSCPFLLLLSLFLVAPAICQARGFGGARLRARPVTYRAAPVQEPLIWSCEQFRFEYGMPGVGTEKVSLEGRRCSLVAKAVVLQAPKSIEYKSTVEQALKRLESVGRLERPIRIYLVQHIKPKSVPLGWDPAITFEGVCFEQDGEIYVVVCDRYFTLGVLSHELFHAYVREQKLALPVWLEEGVAELFETEDGFQQEHVDVLTKDGALDRAELTKYRTPSEVEIRVRATSWAVVYHWCKIEKKPLADLIKLEKLEELNIEAAVKAVMEKK